jgi:drug/metabolite transporter (DMT)-like permease
VPQITEERENIKLIMAYLATYFIWGSTAFAISIVVKHIPPLHSSSLRYFGAGMIIVCWCAFRRYPLPKGKEWINTFIMAIFLLSISNSSTSWACRYVPSSIVVVIQSVIPLMMIILDRVYFHQEKQTLVNYVCVTAGIIGVILIIFSRDLSGIKFMISPLAVSILMLGSFSWAIGSMLIKISPKPSSNLYSSGIAMLISSPVQITAGTAIGERMPSLMSIPLTAYGGIFYLIFMGSILAFCSYSWLAVVEPPSRLGSISFVNPLVALFLGVTFGKESFNDQSVLGTAIIIFVTLMLWMNKITEHNERTRRGVVRC